MLVKIIDTFTNYQNMKKNAQPFETKGHDLSGNASLDVPRKDFNLFASDLAKYNPDRFDAAAIKIFVSKGEFIVTIFAVDKFKQEQNDYPKDKLPVKKFKLFLEWEEFISRIKNFDVVLSNGAYDIEDIVVQNK